jgi:hypothetical protein
MPQRNDGGGVTNNLKTPEGYHDPIYNNNLKDELRNNCSAEMELSIRKNLGLNNPNTVIRSSDKTDDSYSEFKSGSKIYEAEYPDGTIKTFQIQHEEDGKASVVFTEKAPMYSKVSDGNGKADGSKTSFNAEGEVRTTDEIRMGTMEVHSDGHGTMNYAGNIGRTGGNIEASSDITKDEFKAKGEGHVYTGIDAEQKTFGAITKSEDGNYHQTVTSTGGPIGLGSEIKGGIDYSKDDGL